MKCKHGNEHECEDCDDARDAELFNDMEVTCEHGMNEDDCLVCQSRLDNLAEQAAEQREWLHFHSD